MRAAPLRKSGTLVLPDAPMTSRRSKARAALRTRENCADAARAPVTRPTLTCRPSARCRPRRTLRLRSGRADDAPLRGAPRADANLPGKSLILPQALGRHADLARRHADGRRQAVGADEARMLPQKAIDQLVRRIHSRTIRIASRIVSSGPEMRSR